MKKLVYPFLMVACATLVACSTSEVSAPIEERPVKSTAEAKPVVKEPSGPGWYKVQKGDTLYKISREQGHTVANISIWNNLTDPNAISVGQVLRVAPPEAEGTAVITEAVDDTSTQLTPIATTPDASSPVKTEPNGEKQAYSESALTASTTASTAPTTTAASGTRDVSGVVWTWPASGKLLRGFQDGQTKGVDIDGTKGQKVLAAADGRVIYAGTMNGYGNLVIIKHTEELLTAYAHNSANLVQQGSTVKRGQQVAEMGNTGTDTVKLHFEVRRQGKPVDPLEFLPKR